MGRVIPASYSSINSFETCPRKHYHTRVGKTVPDPMGEAALWGNRVHKALERYLTDGEALPKGMRQYQLVADTLAKRFPENLIQVEQQLCVDENFEPTGWWDKNGWFRGVIDVLAVQGDKAYVFDWKTGKQKDDFDQLRLFAALTVAHHPEVKKVVSAFVWLKDGQITRQSFSRDQAKTFWADLVPRVDRLTAAVSLDVWPARPSGLCRKHCPVGKSLCEHCGG